VTRVLVVHWNETECCERVERVRGHGHEVRRHWRQDSGGTLTRMLAKNPPDAVIIDLGRLPSHGRAVAAWMRQRRATRTIPIVFVPGDVEKTRRLREAFPDAAYSPWARIKAAVRKAIANPPKDPVVPEAADYSGTPLPKKLGCKPGMRVGLVRAPKGFKDTLGDLPEGARIINRLSGELGVIVLFCRALTELRADWKAAVAGLADHGSLWVAWPKKASGMLTDLDSGIVRAFGLDQGLVDTKVCAIDDVWSGLRFSRRRAKR